MAKLWQAEIKAKEKAGLPPPPTPVLSDSDAAGNRLEEQPTHIAFGSKVVIPKHARKSSREGGASSAGGRNLSSALNRSGSIPQLTSVSPALEPESGRESSRQTHRLSYQRSFSDATNLHSESSNTQLGVEATQTTIQPRPPRTGSGGKTRRRPLRVKHPGSSKSRSMNDKDAINLSGKSDEPFNGSSGTKDTVSEEKDLDSNQESISRSQSESSLKMSGNDSSLAESFNKFQIKIPVKDQNGHVNCDINSREQPPLTAELEKGSPPVFTFSSRPRSAPRSPRSRQRKQQDFNTSATPAEEKPQIKISSQVPVDLNNSNRLKIQNRGRKGSDRSEYDDDFYKASGESSTEEDDLQNFLKTSGNSRCSSQSSRLSPLPSPEPSPEPDTLSKSQILRMSVRSSLLKEVSWDTVLQIKINYFRICT